jgi:hypothetical protein
MGLKMLLLATGSLGEGGGPSKQRWGRGQEIMQRGSGDGGREGIEEKEVEV